MSGAWEPDDRPTDSTASDSSLEIIVDLYEAMQVMLAVFPIRDGEPGESMHVETLAHEKAGAAMQRAEIFNRDFYRRKAASNVARFYPGIDDSGTIPRATVNEALTGDYVRYEDYDEERNIVNRIWSMLGNPAYPFLDGRSIYDVIQDGLDGLQLLGRYREGHRQPSGQECYINIEQGDYRCTDCIEADRLTGMEHAYRTRREIHLKRLRESLNSPNNGL